MTTKYGNDWICKALDRRGYYCGASNFARNEECYMCDSYKSKSVKGTGSSSSSNARPGDWYCPSCNGHIFASKTHCRKCNIAKPDIVSVVKANIDEEPSSKPGSGDWYCPTCSGLVFARNSHCRNCNTAKPSSILYSHVSVPTVAAAAAPSLRPGDWNCPKCSEHIFASKTHCRKCGTAKSSNLVQSVSVAPAPVASAGPSIESSFEPGDWYCNSCKSPIFNFKSRTVCFNCPALRDLNQSLASSSSHSPALPSLAAPSSAAEPSDPSVFSIKPDDHLTYEANVCVVCLDREAVMVVLACTHKSMCKECCLAQSSCPMPLCRAPYDPFDKHAVLQIYNA